MAYHEGDGLGGMDSKNIMIDHCSVSWSIDECLSVYGNTTQTVQWCIVSQSLVNAGHSKGSHGYGGNWGGSGASFHHNLMAHHVSRTPRLGPRSGTQTDERVDLRNNVFYNWAGNGCYGGEGMNCNIVNNYYKPGPGTATVNTTKQRRIAAIGIRTTEYTGHGTSSANSWDVMWHVWGKYYVDGNVNPWYDDVTADNWTYGMYNQIDDSSNDYTYTSVTKDTIKLDAPLDFAPVTTHTAELAYERVLSYAGASLHRDAVDELIVYDARIGVASYTGATVGTPGMIDSQDDIKPADAADDWSAWPTLASEEPQLDTDGDGMPDEWEVAHDLDPNDASDGATIGSDGYSNLERYMNSLVAAIMKGGCEGGTLTASGYEVEDEVDYGEDDYVRAGMVADYELSTATLSYASGATCAFSDDFSITNASSKTYTAGTDDCLRFYSDVQYTINVPKYHKVTAVKVSGYDNSASADAYISELGGTECSSTSYVFPKKSSGATVMTDHTIDLSADPAIDTLTFTLGSQMCYLKFTLSTLTYNNTGIREVTIDSRTADNRIYNLQGMQVKEPLAKGVYIQNGSKFVVK